MKLLCIKKIAPAAGLALLILLCLPAAVAAHPMKGVGDFYSGMLHPLTALEFLLSWIALAMFAGQQGRKTALLALAIFPSALVLGASLGTVVASPAWLPAMNLVLIPILGLAVVLAISFPTPATVILVALVGLLHGLANGAEITAPVSPWRFIPGLATIAVLVLAYGIGLVRTVKKPWTRIAVRVAGSWITAAGIMICAFKL
jgi:hydrogenase/urease accessory protein HupE